MEKYILTINAGSSSIKFALYIYGDSLTRTWYGRIERIGLADTVFIYSDGSGKEVTEVISIPDQEAAIAVLASLLETHIDLSRVTAVGHRIVPGMERTKHELVTSELIAALNDIRAIDPEHLPLEIAIIEMFAAKYPGLAQVACFDTVFHAEMPRTAQILPIPRRFEAMGVRRYGFHGLSCAYLMEELRRTDSFTANGRVIIAHLGNGASISAVKGGKSIDTSMGFTPAGGIPMSTRSGDLDPGALSYIMKKENLSFDDVNHLINHEAGLLGISEISSDMLELLHREDADVRAKEAVDLFCYEAKKRIGAYAAALGGIDVLIFSGGMGEHAPRIRSRICEGLEFLGIALDIPQNENNSEVISPEAASVCVRVMRTNEELMIANITQALVIN